MDFFATTATAARVDQRPIEGDFAGTSTSMPPSAPFPTSDQRMQLVNWIDCGAP